MKKCFGMGGLWEYPYWCGDRKMCNRGTIRVYEPLVIELLALASYLKPATVEET